MKTNKRLRLYYRNGAIGSVDAHLIADDRSAYIAERDPDTTYEEEYEFVLNDQYELTDWFYNNMDWDQVEKSFILEQKPEFDPADLSQVLDTEIL